MAARDDFDAEMATLLGGDAGAPALPFDPHAPASPAPRYLTAAEAMSAGTIAFTPPSSSPPLPFRRPGSDAPPPAPPAPPSPPPPPPPPLPVMLRERAIWEGEAIDPSRTPPARVLSFAAESRGTLDDATSRGVVAASNAAAAVRAAPDVRLPEVAPQPSRVRWIDDEVGGATLLPVEVLFAPTSPSSALRRASAAHVGCCGVTRLPAITDAATPKDERAAAQHAMSHAAPRSPAELQRELESALSSGAALPSFALTGTLTLSLDPAEIFKVTHALARTFLAETIHGELLALASRVGAELGALPIETISQITSRLEDAVRAQARNLAIETMREQSVLSRRRYLEAPVFGETRIVARLRLSSGGDLPCFLPVTAGASLPLSRVFHAHVVAVVRTAPWPGDGAIALDALALGREVGSRSTREG